MKRPVCAIVSCALSATVASGATPPLTEHEPTSPSSPPPSYGGLAGGVVSDHAEKTQDADQ